MRPSACQGGQAGILDAMDFETAQTLAHLTDAFYRSQAASFSATRKSPWLGWERCTRFLAPLAAEHAAFVRVLDAGCGNLRFERYLSQAFSQIAWECRAVDNCQALLPDEPSASNMRICFQELDIVSRLLSDGERGLSQALEAPACDAAVCFGVMHHVPTFEARADLLRTLLARVRSGGVVCVSFWRFMANAGMARRVRALQPQALADAGFSVADLDRNDYLLGWDARPGVYRYCHHFDDGEVDRLIAALGRKACVADRFVSDGRSGDLNAYLVLRAR